MPLSRANSVASSSSLEIIDDEELVTDLERWAQGCSSREDTPRTSPDQSIVQDLVNSVQGITTSHVDPKQVVFVDVRDSYSFPFDVRVESKGDNLSDRDVIAIFKTPFLDIKDCLAACNVTPINETVGVVSFVSSQLVDKEFYQFQYLRHVVEPESSGKIEHKVCGASVPWQYQPASLPGVHLAGHPGNLALRTSMSSKTWDMTKFDQIESRLWQEDTSKLMEMCLAEQIKEFFCNLEESIQMSFLTALLSPSKLTARLEHKTCSMYHKLARIFNMLADMQVNKEGKTFKDLLTDAVAFAKADWSKEKGIAELTCSTTGELGCKCAIYDFILQPAMDVSEADGCLKVSMCASSRSACSTSSVSSSFRSLQGDSLVSVEDRVKSLVQEVEELKSQVESRDSSILVLEAQNSVVTNLLDKEKELAHSQMVKESEKHLLEKERLKGEINIIKKRLDESVKEKAGLYNKLEAELDQRDNLISRIKGLEADAEQLRLEKIALVKCNDQLKQELAQVNQMLEAAQQSKEAAAMLSRDQSAAQTRDQSDVQTRDQSAATESDSSLSWVKCDDVTPPVSIRDGVDGDLVKVFTRLGIQLEAAKARVKELEALLAERDAMLTETCEPEQNQNSSEAAASSASVSEAVARSCSVSSASMASSSASTTSSTDTVAYQKDNFDDIADKITKQVEARFKEKMKKMEAQSQRSVLTLDAKTKELEKVQSELRKYMDENVEMMSQRLCILQQDTKACDLKFQKLESSANSDAWSDRESVASSGASLASSCNSNMNSIKIASELSGSTKRSAGLPNPLVPERLDTDPGIPELRRRTPSRYSISNVSSWINPEDGSCVFCHQFVSQDEQHVCGKETEASKAHKKQKELLKKDVPFCPICFKTFEQNKSELSKHVQKHFESEIGESFLDLGID